MSLEGGLRNHEHLVAAQEWWMELTSPWALHPMRPSDLDLWPKPFLPAPAPPARLTLSCWQQIIGDTFPVLWGQQTGVTSS